MSASTSYSQMGRWQKHVIPEWPDLGRAREKHWLPSFDLCGVVNTYLVCLLWWSHCMILEEPSADLFSVSLNNIKKCDPGVFN